MIGEATAAALIGAGGASVVGLGSQYLGHVLSVRRDRKNQRRERLGNVIVQAATALYGATDADDYPGWVDEEPKPGTIGAMSPELRARPVAALADKSFRGVQLLQIHFGHRHPLIDAYTDAWEVCTEAEINKWRMLKDPPEERDHDEEFIRAVARTSLAAQKARDEWMTEARRVVEAI